MIFGITRFIGVGLYLYLVWRNLRENYHEEKLISYSWLSMLMYLFGGRVVFGISNWGVWNENPVDWLLLWQKAGFSYAGGLMSMFLLTIWFCRKNQWKLWAFMEDVIGIWYLFMLLMMLGEFWSSGFDLKPLIYLVAAVFGLMIVGIFFGRYRSITWYKSGKKGFIFFFSVALEGLLLTGVSLWYKDRLSVLILYLAISLISLIGLFILGGLFDKIEITGKRRINEKK